jgi:hypothetical protein
LKNKFKKIELFLKKIINSVSICRPGYVESKVVGIDYAEGRDYTDGQIELRRGASTPRGIYAEGLRR